MGCGRAPDVLCRLGGIRTQLVYFKSQGFPMGCATGGGDPMLKEVGLCGGHAYSILECREITSASAPTGTVRLLRIRNPHGLYIFCRPWRSHLLWAGSCCIVLIKKIHSLVLSRLPRRRRMEW